MANVEAPSTFMTSYQQGRQNRRQDRLDTQKLGFSVFDESRRRQKHKAQMDRAMEDTQHLKTMNPLLESLELYKNEKAWNTLDSDISRHKETTRHQKADNTLRERKLQSDVDNLWWQRNQGHLVEQYKDTGWTGDRIQGSKDQKARVDEMIGGTIDNQNTENRINKNMLGVDELASGTYSDAGKNFFKENAEVNQYGEMYNRRGNSWETAKPGGAFGQDFLDLSMNKPQDYALGEYALAEGEQKLDKRGQGIKGRMLDRHRSNIKQQEYFDAEKDRLWEEYDKTTDKDTRIELQQRLDFLTNMINASSGGGGLMQQYLQQPSRRPGG